AMIDHPLGYYRQAYGLYKMLFGSHPLEAGKEYILFPDGALSLLPVEALVTAADCPSSPAEWPFVIRQTLLSYGWSLQTLSEQRAHPGTASGFAGFFLSGGNGSSPVLAAVSTEEDGIKRVVRDGEWYNDSQATTNRFRHALETSAVVHISSHAFIQKNGVDAPHIELFDDPFYLFELQGLAAHPSLVVLSACRTGDGRIVTGEGVQSLARAFTAGGTNAVVAGWWNLNDETAARLTGNYYSALFADESGNAAAALRQAKLQWLNDPAVGYLQKLPYFWAATGYLGNPRPLEKGFFADGHKQQKQGRWWWPLFLLPAGLFIILAYVRGRRGYNRG
ncbi:MAG TPA: CHAT domain-containing protein, partial [Puia sp.]|nr:CHAT domain-containing protein [Puia sp.]